MKPVVVKKLMTEALFSLLEKKPLNRITIQELVTSAGVSRSSFYRNYLTIDVIIDEYLRSLIEEINEKHKINPQNMLESVKQIFDAFVSERDRLLLLSRRNLLYRLPEYMYSVTLRQIKALDVLNNRYQPYFFAGASSALIKAWIDMGMTDTSEYMAKIFVTSLFGYMDFK